MTSWKKCRTCKGTGEVRSCDKDALPANGVATGFQYPTRRGGMSGLIIEYNRSVCGKCFGTGIKHENS